METILIIDAESTGENFIEDILQRGYHPAVMWSWHNQAIFDALKASRNPVEHKYAGVADFYVESQTLEETLEAVRAISPKLILPGSDMGVELATYLADRMGLPGNPYERIAQYTNKYIMHKTLVDNGVRGIRGKIVHNWDEAVSFYREEGFTGCVLKPYRGASSVDVRICESEEQLKEAYDEVFATGNYMGGEEEGMLLQERISGTEYIVNTVSYGGKHRLSALWRHSKKVVPGGGMVYNYTESLNRLEAGCTSLVKYAFSVLDALGVEYGNVHSEIMIDEKGPVLIEVNCRPMGSHMAADFLDRIWGHHETDLCLDAFLHPEVFEAHLHDPYRPLAKGLKKHLINMNERNITSSSILSLFRRQKSACGARLGKAVSDHLRRTVDLSTAAGVLYLVNEDEGQLYRDRLFWENAENEYFDTLFTEKKKSIMEKPDGLKSIEDILSELKLSSSIILLSNDIKQLDGLVVVDSESILKIKDHFQYAILDLVFNENEDYEMMTEDFFALAERVRKGGYIFVPKRTYWHFICGTESIEILCEAAGLQIEAPNVDTGDIVVIYKNS